MKKSLSSVLFLLLMASASIASAQIQMTFSITEPTCHGYNDGSVSVLAVGGSGSYSYAWNNGQTTQACIGISGGLYTVTVTDALQQTASGSITVSQPASVSAAITSIDINCSGTSGTLTATGFGGTPPYTYAWSGAGGPSGSETISVTGPGVYTVSVTDKNTCTGTSSFTVAKGLTLQVVATDILCASNPASGSLNAVVDGGNTPYTFSWSNGSSTQSQSGVGTGPFFCTVTSANGCIAVDSDYVDIPTALEVKTVWLTPACGGNNNGTAIVEAIGGVAPYAFTWNPGGLNGASQTGLAPNQYTVLTTDANQCKNELAVTIPATNGLDVQLIVTSASCKGIDNAIATAVVNPSGTGYIYTWTLVLPNGTSNQLTGVVKVIDLAVGTTVSVTVTDPTSGCTGTTTAVVGEHAPIHIAIIRKDIPCSGGLGSASVVASNGTPQYTYTWSNDNGTVIGHQSTITNLLPGAYGVSVVDSLGCEAKDVVNIAILSAPNAAIDGDSVLVCGDSLSTVQFTNLSADPFNVITNLMWTVTGGGVDTIIYQQNQIVFQLPVNQTIQVILIAASGNGCADTTSISYNVPGYPDIQLNLDSTSINCVDAPVSIEVIGGEPDYDYQWSPGVTLNPTPLNVLVSPAVTTTYILTATDGNACTATAGITIAPLDSLIQLSVADSLIQGCMDSVTLFASTNIASSIIWSQGGQILPGNPVVVPATPTTTIYTVTATTADNCVLTDEVSVTGYGLAISLDPNIPGTICEGDSLPLSVNITPVSTGVTYLWTVNAPGMLINPTSANPILTGPDGNYVVSVIVKNEFCADTLKFPVVVLPSFELDGKISLDLCKGLTVTFTNTSGVPGQWNFGDMFISNEINPVHDYNAPGQYQVIFTPSIACTAPWDSLITVFADTLTADITHLYVDCAPEAIIQFNGTNNHPGPAIWNWNFSNGTPATSTQQNPVVTYTVDRIYLATLTVSDVNRCTAKAIDTVTVSIIADLIADSLRICPGDSIQLNPTGIDNLATYVWTSSPTDPNLEANNPNPTVSPIVPTTYTVEIEKGLCTVTYSVLVSFKPGSDVDLPGDTIVCSNDSLSITAQSNGATGYEWSNSASFSNIFATTQTVQVLPIGAYYVRTTGAACFDVDSIKVELFAPEIQIIPTDLDICQGEAAALIVENLIPGQNLAYIWTPMLPNVANPIVSPAETTTYLVTATNQFGCTTTLSLTVNVTTVNVSAEAEPDTVTIANPFSTLNAISGGNGNIVSYSWAPPGTLSTPNSAQTLANPTETTLYTVTVLTTEGCIAIDTVTVYYRKNACISPFVFIPKAFSPNNDDKNDRFIVRAEGMTELKFIVWNRWGEVVYETDDPNASGWDGSFKGKEATGDSFAWYVTLTCGNGDIFESKGNVTLLK